MKPMGEDDICAACGEPIEFRPGESFTASTDGKVWHYGCSPRLNPNQSEQAMNAEAVQRLTEALERHIDGVVEVSPDDLRAAIEALSANTVAPEHEPEPGTCKQCGSCPVNADGLCATCEDEAVVPDGGEMIACLGSAVEARPFLNADAYRAPDTVAPDHCGWVETEQAPDAVAPDDAELVEALRAVKAYYFDAEPCGHTEAYVCDLVCQALERHAK